MSERNKTSYIIELLRNYRKNRAEYNKLYKEREGKQESLKGNQHEESKDEAIEASQISAVTYDFRSAPTNKFHSATESAAINLDNICDNSMDFKSTKEEINVLTKRLNFLSDCIYKVESVILVRLTDREYFIVDNVYIRGNTWKYTTNEYNKHFNENAQEETLKSKKYFIKNELEQLLAN